MAIGEDPVVGTAVALRCSHRVSVDFDFFSARPLEQACKSSSQLSGGWPLASIDWKTR